MTLSTKPLALSPLPGWINTFYRNYKGKRLGPYYVRRWKVGYKVCRQYIRPADLEKVRDACQRYQDACRRYREPFDTLNTLFRSNDTFIDNFGFLLRIWTLEKRRKPIPVAFGKFLHRLASEGMRITGRPSLRRKVTRYQAIVDGHQVIVKTVHEHDGTTTVSTIPLAGSGNRQSAIFMVPNSTKNQFEPKKCNQVSFEQQFADLYKAIFGHQPKRSPVTESLKPKAQLRPS